MRNEQGKDRGKYECGGGEGDPSFHARLYFSIDPSELYTSIVDRDGEEVHVSTVLAQNECP
jgi:hypothetical protein